MTEKLDLSELERLCASATPEPWRTLTDGDGNTAIVQTAHLTRDVWQIPRCDEDLELIVALRNAAPQMLARLRALERVAAAAKDASRLRLFISTYSGRALDQPRGLAILDALDAALKEAGL